MEDTSSKELADKVLSVIIVWDWMLKTLASQWNRENFEVKIEEAKRPAAIEPRTPYLSSRH